MRSMFVPALLLSVALTGAAQTRPQRKPSTETQRQAKQFQEDQKAIAQLQEEEVAANIAFDVEKLLSLYTDDIIVLQPQHAPIHGKEALRAYYQEAKKELGNADILGYEQTWDEVQITGDWAYQWGELTMRTQTAGGKESTSNFRALRILKRQPDGAWLIARAMLMPASEPAPPPVKK